jgi:release factor glutamine methyltransferase
MPSDLHALAALLAGAGFVAPEEEARELLASAGGDHAVLTALATRRLTGEPLAWIVGRVTFCDVEILVDPGVYVPRCQTELLARRALELLPPGGTAVDLCTGTGAIARILLTARTRTEAESGSRSGTGRRAMTKVLATDLDERAVACARANGVDAYCGNLFDPVPGPLEGRVDLVVAVVPYVPTPALALLQRDTLTFESPLSYDGGPDGTDILRRVLTESPRYLRPGGKVLLELGGDESDALNDDLGRLGYVDVALLRDDDDDVRGFEATWSGPST